LTLFHNRDALRDQFLGAKPFPHIKIDNFIEPEFAQQVAAAYPSFEKALSEGKSFAGVNERRKVQITDSSKFAAPITRLNEMLAAPSFLDDLGYITNIPKLLADAQLVGGGMHMTGPGGRLDVHIDFNFMEDRKLHRRLNLLLYLNRNWQESWGGQIQLWDEEVRNCLSAFTPQFNRCVIFETSEISYHGVVPVAPIAPYPRISFATYYYTNEAPAHWTGVSHTTIFKARPSERLRRLVLMPAEQLQRKVTSGVLKFKRGVSRLVNH
jgi:Rps23 Pro-64 3,4-dihydroxylase Tpa1-like proline 4-hydroxylase